MGKNRRRDRRNDLIATDGESKVRQEHKSSRRNNKQTVRQLQELIEDYDDADFFDDVYDLESIWEESPAE